MRSAEQLKKVANFDDLQESIETALQLRKVKLNGHFPEEHIEASDDDDDDDDVSV